MFDLLTTSDAENSQGISMVIYTNSGLAIPQLKEAVDNDWHLLSPVYRAFPQGG
jgi:hypothetical protein